MFIASCWKERCEGGSVEGFVVPAPAPAEFHDGMLEELCSKPVGDSNVFTITQVAAMLAK